MAHLRPQRQAGHYRTPRDRDQLHHHELRARAPGCQHAADKVIGRLARRSSDNARDGCWNRLAHRRGNAIEVIVAESEDIIPVFYREDMLAEADSFSPSAGKPRHVVAAWDAASLPIRIESYPPATLDELCRSHDAAYVRGVLSLEFPNGFDNRREDVARSLPWTTGAMLAAAREALRRGVACAPVSGFHHAHYASGGGFCTFNGLTVSASALLSEGIVRRVLILDCDQHFGDGTEQILERLDLERTVENVSFGRWFDAPQEPDAYLAELGEQVSRFADFDLVLYQAGADVHVDDPLGGVLTTGQMIERDRIVFEAARDAGVPIAWNLAGGYQEPLSRVVELHVNTMRCCALAYKLVDSVRRNNLMKV
jgi:acetoin utilization deacetylase AcuC-like enzyme